MQTQQSQPLKRSRAEVYRDRVQIRLALDEAGPEIGKLLADNGVVLPGVTWEKVFPHWLIACDGDEVIGCVQVLPAKPVGYLEFLFVKPSAGFKLKAIAIRKLLLQGFASLYQYGSKYVGGVVSTKNKKFADVLGKLNFVPVSSADIHLKRLV